MTEHSVAVFIDVENIHYSTLNNYSETPDWSSILNACKAYGRIASIQAFGDWIEFKDEISQLQKNGIQPIFVPLSQDGKSSLDCYLTVAAMKLFFQNDTVDTIVLASGDRDYIPLLAELKAIGKRIVILGVKETISHDLVTIADDIIAYEPDSHEQVETAHRTLPEPVRRYILDTLEALEKLSQEGRWVNLARLGLALKKDSTFSHSRYGYKKLVELLLDIPEVEIQYDNFEKTIAFARLAASREPSQPSDRSYRGTIDYINYDKGYGFIGSDEIPESVFFHFTRLMSCPIEELQPGDAVQFSLYETERGLGAENIEKVAE